MLTKSRHIYSSLLTASHLVRRIAAGGGGGFSFNMTAGDFVGVLQGYSDGSQTSAFGSIDAEPLPGNNLALCISGSLPGITFHGDATSTLTGLTVWVDSVEYPFDGQDWMYNSDSDLTESLWDVASPTFVNTNAYFVEIK
jgi:hypothetical protein